MNLQQSVNQSTSPVVPSFCFAFASTDVSEVRLLIVHLGVTFEIYHIHLRTTVSQLFSFSAALVHYIPFAWTGRHMIHIANYKE